MGVTGRRGVEKCILRSHHLSAVLREHSIWGAPKVDQNDRTEVYLAHVKSSKPLPCLQDVGGYAATHVFFVADVGKTKRIDAMSSLFLW